MQERLKTKSKNFYDSEIEGIFPNGDIILKEGVKRLKYKLDIDPFLEESYINYEDLNVKRMEKIRKKLGIERENEEQSIGDY